MASNSPLLALPRELRDAIYAYIATDDCSVRVKKTKPTNACPFIISSPLILTCTQVHDEYCEDVLVNVFSTGSNITISILVDELDFDRALEFLRHLRPTELGDIGTRERIQVTLCSSNDATLSKRGLNRWITTEWSTYCRSRKLSITYVFSQAGYSGDCYIHHEPPLRIKHEDELQELANAVFAWSKRRTLTYQIIESMRKYMENDPFPVVVGDWLDELAPRALLPSAANTTNSSANRKNKHPARPSSRRPTTMLVVGGVRRWRKSQQSSHAWGGLAR
ncbi:hypothetical protein LTR56_024194 [Elasticomyces elasticus]|nr:hypothetical protein LTR56_024194 [Elasticomyces elasticus]KAK3640587.1 hypothetical protein LTR22_016963 [Elasticomyces elasticus]KAK4910219.1 hypothetical protein LTR49_021110 [Elasticomyces elasticus]KAK5759951.1 hypothetical protein LTS12_009847 [Elasticomyces elasticus]